MLVKMWFLPCVLLLIFDHLSFLLYSVATSEGLTKNCPLSWFPDSRWSMLILSMASKSSPSFRTLSVFSRFPLTPWNQAFSQAFRWLPTHPAVAFKINRELLFTQELIDWHFPYILLTINPCIKFVLYSHLLSYHQTFPHLYLYEWTTICTINVQSHSLISYTLGPERIAHIRCASTYISYTSYILIYIFI